MNRACANGGAPAKGSRRRGRSQEPLRGASPTRIDGGVQTLVVQDQRHGLADGRVLCSAADLPSPTLRRRRDGITFFTNDDDARRAAGDAAIDPLKDTAAGVALALRRGPLFFKAGRCGTRPQAATQLVGAVARGRRHRGPHGREARAAGPPHARRAVVAVESSTELPEEGARVGLAAAFGWHLVWCFAAPAC